MFLNQIAMHKEQTGLIQKLKSQIQNPASQTYSVNERVILPVTHSDDEDDRYNEVENERKEEEDDDKDLFSVEYL